MYNINKCINMKLPTQYPSEWCDATVQSVRIMRCRAPAIVITLVRHQGDLAIKPIKCLCTILLHSDLPTMI